MKNKVTSIIIYQFFFFQHNALPLWEWNQALYETRTLRLVPPSNTEMSVLTMEGNFFFILVHVSDGK